MCDKIETCKSDGFREDVKWSDFEQVRTDFDHHVVSELSLVVNFDERAWFWAQIDQLKLFALLNDLSMLVFDGYFETLYLVGQSTTNPQTFPFCDIISVLRAVEVFYNQANGCRLLRDHLRWD